MRSSRLLAAVVALSSVSAAWPSFFDNGNALGHVHNILYGRQDDSNSETSSETSRPRETATNTPSKDEDKPTTTGNKDNSKTTDKPSATDKNTKSSDTKSARPTNKVFDDRIPAGGIAMITPAPIAGPQFYKVGEWVTFAWNYTSLSVTPTAIDIMATCTANQATYTLAVNQTVNNDTGTVLWDTKQYQETASVPLLTEKYTLLIYDSDESSTQAPRAGYLAPFNQFSFGMYTPQPYVAWEDFKCANCNPNAGLSAFESLTLKALLITSGTTVVSLFYFASSFGVL